MSGLFASLSVERAWKKVLSFLSLFSPAPSSSTSSASHQDDLDELRKLERTMHRIRATLHDAEEHWNIREQSAKLRLNELKDVAYDIEDVVDEYEYEVKRCKIEALDRADGVHSTGKRKHQEDTEAYPMDTGVVAVPYDLVLQARTITKRFKEIMHYAKHMSLSENDGERRFAPDITTFRHTSSVVSEKSILGREQDKDKVISKLLSREGENGGSHVSVMAIVGMGGVGKTTLAQLVYNSPRVRQSFEKHAWVCVSEQFDVCTITRNIITSLTRQECKYTQLADLQSTLADEVNEKEVLLVLDDVWNERADCWELFCNPLTFSKICQIIVTTRSKKVAGQTMPFYRLDCLSFGDSWSLFSKAACIGEQEVHNPTNLIKIGKSIVKRCNGLPLAIKTLGSMLHYETDERRWKDVLESELWDLEQPRHEVLPALELSYRHMPVDLRRCLLSLSLYPKDCSLSEKEVLRCWKLLDLFPYDGSDDKYAIGRLCLKGLVQRSMLQTLNYRPDAYCLHDLIHDLACFLAGEEFYRVEVDPLNEIPQNVRYLSIHKNITAADSSVFPHSLRAIMVFDGNEVDEYEEEDEEEYKAWHILLDMDETTAPEALFSNCKKLRVLDIRRSRLQKVLPHNMGNLKLLRHLSLSRMLTVSLDLHKENLALSGIGNLINLHTFSGLNVSKSCCSFNIRDLKNINEVRELHIFGLGEAGDVRYAKEAKLHTKKHLQSLGLDFYVIKLVVCSCGLRPETLRVTHYQVLDSLRPHCSLRTLTISDYDSAIYPSWLGDPSFIMLTTIKLWNFQSEHLPVLSGLPSLKNLEVMSCMESVDIGIDLFRHSAGDKFFPSLTNLKFECMSKWSQWSEVGAGEPPCLNKLSLEWCEKLRSLPLGPLRCLVTLDLTWCDSIYMLPALPALRELSLADCSSLSEIPSLPSLLKLDISGCPNLTSIGSHASFPPWQLQCSSSTNLSAVSSPTKLTSFDLREWQNLSVGDLPSLTSLEIKCNRNELFYILLDDLPSLRCLRLYAVEVTSIHLKQGSLPSLTKLILERCDNLEYCDGLASLTSLEHLDVTECSKLPIYNLRLPQLKSLNIRTSFFLNE